MGRRRRRRPIALEGAGGATQTAQRAFEPPPRDLEVRETTAGEPQAAQAASESPLLVGRLFR